MKRYTITLIEDNNSGPFNIFYNVNIVALLENGMPAMGITAAQLSSGIDVLVEDNVTSIFSI